MKIPRYWAKDTCSLQDPRGKTFSAICWRWSDTSVEDARQQARVGAQQIAGKLLNQQHLDRYSYGERPMREEITRAITNAQGKEIALVTRNAYGALVLNAANAMFIDIDFKEEKSPGPFGKLFSRSGPTQEETRLQSIEQWAQRNPGLGLRVYRTFGGLRCLVTNEVFDPTQESTLGILKSVDSDPLYVRLCRSQGCFRARLTPKPWRCGLGKPPSRFPWDNHREETSYRQWEQTYTLAASNYAVCKLVKQIGGPTIHPDVEPILSMHDGATCSALGLELA
jgi:hypothetical protein